MNITRITAHPLVAPFARPLYTAHEALRDATVVLVEVAAGDVKGYGIVHAAPVKAICEWVDRLAAVVAGRDALAHEAAWDRLFALTMPRPSGMYGGACMPNSSKSSRSRTRAGSSRSRATSPRAALPSSSPH